MMLLLLLMVILRSVVPVTTSSQTDEVSNQIRSADKISIVDGVHFASAVTVVRTADEFD